MPSHFYCSNETHHLAQYLFRNKSNESDEKKNVPFIKNKQSVQIEWWLYNNEFLAIEANIAAATVAAMTAAAHNGNKVTAIRIIN